METALQPLAKRRKFGEDIADKYITIATVVEYLDAEEAITNLACTYEDDLRLVLKSTKLEDDTIRGHFVASDRKISLSLPFTRSVLPKDSMGEILFYCHQLEPRRHYVKGREPLVCYDICLNLGTHLSTSRGSHYIQVKLLWQDTARPRNKVSDQQFMVLDRYLRTDDVAIQPTKGAQKWNPRDFYDSAHVPPEIPGAPAELAEDLFDCHLYPFQRRTVHWLLKREGVETDGRGRIQPCQRDRADLPPSFFESHDAAGRSIYVSQLLGCVVTSLADLLSTYQNVNGGVLAEEMGLGKTVELIALICSHRRPDCHPGHIADPGLNHPNTEKLAKSRATLIITPPSILQQWKQELEEHAPGLKVLCYNDLNFPKGTSLEQQINKIAANDVVLTTYPVLAREFHYASHRPDRQLRHRVRYEPPRSPLVEISWWRVCLDEAQMVESGISQPAQVARLIPRVNAWAVSGTPLRSDHKDLWGLFLFLRFEPFSRSLLVWNRLVDFYRPLFKKIVDNAVVRNSKTLVRDDLRLPSQVRHTVTVPFTAIEEQHYHELFNAMCEDVGLDRSGAPVSGYWNPNDVHVVERMRTWLNRLRQTCLHPEIGAQNRRALRKVNGSLRSVMQVLEVMIDQNEGAIRQEQRSISLSKLRRGQIFEYAKQPANAIELWKPVYEQMKSLVSECRVLLAAELQQHKSDHDVSGPLSEKQGVDGETEDSESRSAIQRQRLRTALEVQHMAIFFLGNGYYQMKTQCDKDLAAVEYQEWESREEAAFEEAKQIRSELLSDVSGKTRRLMNTVRRKASDMTLVQIPDMIPSDEQGGIETRKIIEKFQSFCSAMNSQAAQYTRWRDQMVEMLQHRLIDTEDGNVELSGHEYEVSAQLQDETYVFLEGLRALHADRHDALTGQINLLISNETRHALQLAKRGEGPAPAKLCEILSKREGLRLPPEVGSLRGIISELRQLMTTVQWQEGSGSKRAKTELAIILNILRTAQAMSNEQRKVLNGEVEPEISLLRDTMNSRLEYYRALQKISDTVVAFEVEGQQPGHAIKTEELARCIADEEQRGTKLSALLAKRRYLVHLKEEQTASSTQRLCVICQSPFERGTLTVCGHVYCQDCILLWWNHHRSCPTCKKPLKSTDFYDITYKPQDVQVQKEADTDSHFSRETSCSGTESAEGRRTSNRIYSDISAAELNEIKNVDLQQSSSFGTKVDMICRHILWLRDHDPGSKSIIFSQYRDFLDVLKTAMAKNQITYSCVDDKDGIERFKKSTITDCFLLHAKAHSAGLNLVNANHVVLCEPLINTALELQAIARVHRIGQRRETTVWMYLIAGTIEESIYDISVTRRLGHLNGKHLNRQASNEHGSGNTSSNGVRDREGAIDIANSLELESADLSKLVLPGKGGGERVEPKDLWQCLFGTATRRQRASAATLGDADRAVGRLLRAEPAEQRQERGSNN